MNVHEVVEAGVVSYLQFPPPPLGKDYQMLNGSKVLVLHHKSQRLRYDPWVDGCPKPYPSQWMLHLKTVW
jgi:hypothetical protein